MIIKILNQFQIDKIINKNPMKIKEKVVIKIEN